MKKTKKDYKDFRYVYPLAEIPDSAAKSLAEMVETIMLGTFDIMLEVMAARIQSTYKFADKKIKEYEDKTSNSKSKNDVKE